MKHKFLTWPLLAALLVQPLTARVGSYGNVSRTQVQNRSVSSQNVNRNIGAQTNIDRSVSRDRDVNVNRDSNVNVSRDIDVHGGYCCVVHDNDWNWGAFAVGATASAVTTAAVAAAARPSQTAVVVAPPAAGTVVSALPAGCTTVAASGTAIYNCSNVYYRPFFQGSTLVYQVVQP